MKIIAKANADCGCESAGFQKNYSNLVDAGSSSSGHKLFKTASARHELRLHG
jgi:hypothetical protein